MERKTVTFDNFSEHLGIRSPLGASAGYFGGVGVVAAGDGGGLLPMAPPNLAVASFGAEVHHLARLDDDGGDYPYLALSGTTFYKGDDTFSFSTISGSVSVTSGTDGWTPFSTVRLPGNSAGTCFVLGLSHAAYVGSGGAVTVTGSHPGGGGWSCAIYNGRIYSTGNSSGTARERVYYTAYNDYNSAGAWTADGSGNFDLGEGAPLDQTEPRFEQAEIVGVLRDGIYFHLDGVIWRLSGDAEIGSLTRVTNAWFSGTCQFDDIILGVTRRGVPAVFDGVAVREVNPYLVNYGQSWMSAALPAKRQALLLPDRPTGQADQDGWCLSGNVWSAVSTYSANKAEAGMVPTATGDGFLFVDGTTDLSELVIPYLEADAAGTFNGSDEQVILPYITEAGHTVAIREVWVEGTAYEPAGVQCRVNCEAIYAPVSSSVTDTFTISATQIGNSGYNTSGHWFRAKAELQTGRAMQAGAIRVMIDQMRRMKLDRVTVVYDMHPIGGPAL